jgi:DNA-binding NarL/FixJ family response regulator
MHTKLLIVDDSELIRNSLVRLLLEIPGIESIRTADSLVRALDCVEQEEPNLIILDLHLPDGNASRLIEPLKWLAPLARIAMLTNDASEYSRRQCLDQGADWFFDKSTEFERLLEVVRDLAAGAEH